jgi:hypothetical protein
VALTLEFSVAAPSSQQLWAECSTPLECARFSQRNDAVAPGPRLNWQGSDFTAEAQSRSEGERPEIGTDEGPCANSANHHELEETVSDSRTFVFFA